MSIQIIEMLIPKSNKRTRPGRKRTPRTITIHETANTSVRANALAHARLQYNGNRRTAAWHYQVDDEKQVYRSLPDNEVGYAAGDGAYGPGNSYSIHIEICVNRDGNFSEAVNNASELVKYLIKKHDSITHVDVVQHHRWSGKDCPRFIRAGTKGINWSQFISLVRSSTTQKVTQPSAPPAYRTDNNNFKIGQKVTVKKNAKTYATGEKMASFVPGNTYTVMQRGSNRMLLKEIMSWVRTSDLDTGTSSKTSSSSSKGTYTVKKNDTLYGIASSNGVSVDALKKANNLKTNLIHPGDKLTIPGKTTSKKSTPVKKSTSKKKYDLPNATYWVKSPQFNGSGVKTVQQALASIYFYPDKGARNNGVDGYYGPKTANAVKRFQLIHMGSDEADGSYGPKTKKVLDKHVN